MKTDIHPEYTEVTVTCVCGHSFKTRSTMGKDFHLEICSECHPFFTGKQKLVDTAGRVERFRKRYGDKYTEQQKTAGKNQAAQERAPAPEAKAEEPAAEESKESKDEKPSDS